MSIGQTPRANAWPKRDDLLAKSEQIAGSMPQARHSTKCTGVAGMAALMYNRASRFDLMRRVWQWRN